MNRRRRVLPPAALITAVVVLCAELARRGAAQAARGERVLHVLDPFVALVRTGGGASTEWALRHAVDLAGLASAAAFGVALGGLATRRRQALPLLFLAAAISSVTCGQIALLADNVPLGVWLYAAGVAGAAILGILCPLTRLEGFPPLPSLRARPDGAGDVVAAPRAASTGISNPWVEHALVFGLTAVGLLVRIYALNELPDFFDGEMSVSMLASRTFDGLHSYFPWGMPGNSTGIVHLLPQMALFRLFGTSIYSLRLVSVFAGVSTIPLFYWLVRRLAGGGPALAATALFLAAPEQLFWSRSEDTHFAPIAVLALITAHLGLSMITRLRPLAVLAAVLWMPVCRFFYAAGMVAFALPPALYAHCLLFVRGAWRSVWYAAPMLLGGLTLWLISFPVVFSILVNTPWRFVDPTVVTYVDSVFHHQGELRDVETSQVTVVANNLVSVAKSMTYDTGFSHWFQRVDLAKRATTINVARAAALVFGIGYLLGQCYDRRAALLLGWVAIGLVPGVVSIQAADRRMALMFPAFDVIIGVALAAVVRIVRQRGGPGLARFATAVLGTAVAAVAWSSLASHLLLPTGPIPINAAFQFVARLLDESDAIFHNLDPSSAMLLEFGNLDRLLEPGKTPGIQFVPPDRWLDTALRPQCLFNEPAYGFAFSRDKIEALRSSFSPQRVSFLLHDDPRSREPLDLLRRLFPHAELRRHVDPSGEIHLLAMTVGITDIAHLQSPAVAGAEAQPTGILVGVATHAGAAPDDGGITVRGGLTLDTDNWYRFALAPDCPEARLSVDAKAATALRPLLAGVHQFELTVPRAGACRLPLQLLARSRDAADWAPVPTDHFLSPEVAALPAVQPPALASYAGYGAPRLFGSPPGAPIDFGLDANGNVTALFMEGPAFRLRRYRPDGREDGAWQIAPPDGRGFSALAVGPDGTSYLMAASRVVLVDRTGAPIGLWKDPPIGTVDVAILPDRRLLGAVPTHDAIAVVRPDGSLEREWDQFDGGPGRFRVPFAVTLSATGDLLVIEEGGQALLFHTPLDQFAPTFVRTLRLPHGMTHGIAFDGARIVVPDPGSAATLTYSANGERVLAADPTRDPSTMDFGGVARFESLGDQLYVLDRNGRLWVLSSRE